MMARSATSFARPITPISIGRHPQCVLWLDSDLVSRQHAIVEVGPSSIRVEDVSTNGTMAGDQLLRRQAADVPFGTPIVVGNFNLSFWPVEVARPRGKPLPLPAPVPLPKAAPVPANRAVAQPVAANRAAAPPVAAAGGGRKHVPASVVVQPVENDAAAAPSPQQLSAAIESRKKDVNLRRKIHRMLLEHLDLATIDAQKLDDPSMRPKVLNALRRIVEQVSRRDPGRPEPRRADRRAGRRGAGPRSARALPGRSEHQRGDGRRPEHHLHRARREDRPVRGPLHRRRARARRHRAHRHAAGPSHRRVLAARGRAPQGRLPRQRRHQAASRYGARASPSASSPRTRSRSRISKSFGALTDQMGRFLTRCVEREEEHHHLGRHGERQDDAAQRPLGGDPGATSAS